MTKEKKHWWLLTNSGDKKDVALTLMVISFTICCILAIVGAIQTVTIGTAAFVFNEFSGTFAMTVYGVSSALYFGRRYTTSNHELYKHQALYAKGNNNDNKSEEEGT